MSSLQKMDRISELPEPILHHILFFMPTKDAARTSVLSKRWKITWYSLPKYQFCFNKELYEKQEDFMDCVGKALSILGKQKVIIEAFNLSMIVSRNGSCASCVNHWIELASRNYIKVLALDFKIKSEIEGIDQYRLPDTTNVESIASLTLSNCELKSPLFCSFLKDLSLTNVSVCDKQIVQNLLSNCSVLQSFHIENCLGVKKLRLNHLRLKEATFKGVRDVDIEAVPNLEKLEYTYSRGPSNLEVIDDCNNLKELTLGSLFMPGHEIQQHVSKFTSLETLKLEISFVLEKLQISIAHLKSLSFLSTDYEYLRELDIDCPNLCEFKCSSMVIPSVLSINAACLEDVTINIMPHGSNIHPQWFLHLRKYIAEFKQVNCLELSIPDQVTLFNKVYLLLDKFAKQYDFNNYHLNWFCFEIIWEFFFFFFLLKIKFWKHDS